MFEVDSVVCVSVCLLLVLELDLLKVCYTLLICAWRCVFYKRFIYVVACFDAVVEQKEHDEKQYLYYICVIKINYRTINERTL